MSPARWFPRSWRARYGDELAAMLEELDPDRRTSWGTRFDLARAGSAERLRILAPGSLPPRERAREGALLVLYAWVLFVVAGFGIEKASEHWQAVTPAADRPVPSAAFNVLYSAAGVGSMLVLAGVAVALPAVVALLRAGGWNGVRRPILRAAALSLLALGLTLILAEWGQSLTPAKRNGSDNLYSAAFVVWFAAVVTCLFAWGVAAAAVARRLELSRVVLRLEAGLAAGVAAAMVVMTIASVVWWASLANVAPWFFSGRPIGSGGDGLDPNLIVATAVALVAATLGLLGAARSVRGELARR